MVRRQWIVVLAACSSALLLRPAGGRAGEARTVKLKFESGGVVGSIYTPVKLVQRGIAFSSRDAAYAKVSIGGAMRVVAGRWVGDGYMAALDCDGNGKISSGEWARLGSIHRDANFRLKVEGLEADHPYAVRLIDVRVGIRNNQPINISGRALIAGCRTGRLGEIPIRIFDDNLDGRYTQDGRDAIAIGGCPGAMPLWKAHQVGASHYELRVDPEGLDVTLTPLTDLKLGRVAVPLDAANVRCLFLVDEDSARCYDVRSSGKTGIPEGSYKLAYGVLAAGKRLLVAGGTKESLTYNIEPDVLNVLRFGAPATVTFRARFHQGREQLRVNVPITPYGAGGERYEMRFAGYHPFGDPHVVLANGNAVLSNNYMGYSDQDMLRELHEWVPKGMSRQHGKIVMTVNLPVLGKAVGVYKIADVADGNRMKPPPPKRPAVATRKLATGVSLTAAPPKPRPTPPAPKPTLVTPPPPPTPRPKPKPPKPVAADPEYEAQLALNIAKAFIKQGRKEEGVAKLKDVVKKYPKTAAAKAADDMLLNIEIGIEP